MGSARPLLLTGFMGTGKSTVGRAVAQRTGSAFVDLDELVEKREGSTIERLFAERGEAGFRAAEATALESVLSDGEGRVVALGGGALLDTARRRSVLERACVVALVARTAT